MTDKMVIPGPGDDSPGSSEEQQEEQRELFNWDLLFDFHAMIGELRQTDGIVEVEATMHDPVPNFTIETIEHGLGILVPSRIKSFYQITDGLEFSWSYEHDGQLLPGGGAHIFDFATVFDNWLDSLWHSLPEHSDEEQDFLWSLRGVDRDLGPESSKMVVMCVEEDYPTYDLFVHDLDSHTSELLELTFREYFDCLLTSRGTYGWRGLLTEDTDGDGAEAFFEVMDRFFPHAKLDRWRG
ncbi:hypothetical protein FIV42_13625 [Persicimonas caeni]|uniref:SMI1/KNR4 family protein n=1 Tax=Persicimonas caeni TaxID=2292766 RepID=A0A4Y6PUG1_PERCE|nr:hypothetical protein [Persicimonas caeni]QDG51749.1 hypothetical protein FIV42_13625 [Persicimonas caeni]QED32970.1 hypothetical protein FRD00_13620 [Persicimonas caeni]